MINFVYPFPLWSALKKSLFFLPTPSNISSMWNFGFLLGASLLLQIITGVFLAIHYCGDIELSFASVNAIMQETNGGWATRMAHANGASAFFVCLYLHLARGIYYGSFLNIGVWVTGVIILLLVMATAFMGYVLPWGQMSFWGATVITNLFSAVPYLGEYVVTWLWGGFAVDNATLSRFFAFHFLVPFLICGLVVIHLLILHDKGSSNPLGVAGAQDKVPFHPYFLWKDLFSLGAFFLIVFFVILFFPWLLGDPENFIPANPLVTPVHIQPEWYFLFAYAILRSIPNKLGGVLALLFSVLILLSMVVRKAPKVKSLSFSPFAKGLFWLFISNFFLLTWIGARPVEAPYVWLGQIFTVFYFAFFLFLNPLKNLEFRALES